MGLGWGKKLLGRFGKANARIPPAAVRDLGYEGRLATDDVLQFEQHELADENAADADEEAFKGGLLKEDALIRKLGQLQRQKFTTLKILQAGRAARIRLAMAKRVLNSKLAIGTKRVQHFYDTFGMARYGKVDPSFGAKLQLLRQEQMREVEMIEAEVSMQIKELQEEAVSIERMFQHIKEQKAVLAEYNGVLVDESSRMIDAAAKKTDEIRLARQEAERKHVSSGIEKEALRTQRYGLSGMLPP